MGKWTKTACPLFVYVLFALRTGWDGSDRSDKKRTRINAVLTVLNSLPYPDKDPAVVAPPDPLIVGLAFDMFPIEGRLVLRVART